MPKLGNNNFDDEYNLTSSQSLNKAKKRVIEKMKGSLLETSQTISDNNAEENMLRVNKLLEDQINILDNMDSLVNSKGSIVGRPSGQSRISLLPQGESLPLPSPLKLSRLQEQTQSLPLSVENINTILDEEQPTSSKSSENIDEVDEMSKIKELQDKILTVVDDEFKITGDAINNDIDKMFNSNRDKQIDKELEKTKKEYQVRRDNIQIAYDNNKKFNVEKYKDNLNVKVEEELRKAFPTKDFKKIKAINSKDKLVVDKKNKIMENMEYDKLVNKYQLEQEDKHKEDLAKLQREEEGALDQQYYLLLGELKRTEEDTKEVKKNELYKNLKNKYDNIEKQIYLLNLQELLKLDEIIEKNKGNKLENIIKFLNLSNFSLGNEDEDFKEDVNILKGIHNELEQFKNKYPVNELSKYNETELEEINNLYKDINERLYNQYDKLIKGYPNKLDELYRILVDNNMIDKDRQKIYTSEPDEVLQDDELLPEPENLVTPLQTGEGRYSKKGGATGARFYKEGSYIDYLTYLNRLISNQKTINNNLVKIFPYIKFVSMNTFNTYKELTETYKEKAEYIYSEAHDNNGDIVINRSGMKNLDLNLIKRKWQEYINLSMKYSDYYMNTINNYNEARTKKSRVNPLSINKLSGSGYYIGEDVLPKRYL
jgi:hypothetical protein